MRTLYMPMLSAVRSDVFAVLPSACRRSASVGPYVGDQPPRVADSLQRHGCSAPKVNATGDLATPLETPGTPGASAAYSEQAAIVHRDAEDIAGASADTGYGAPDDWWDLTALIPNSAAITSVTVTCGSTTAAQLQVPPNS